MKVILNIPDTNFHHENHCKSNLRDYIKEALDTMGGCKDPREFPYFHGLRGVTVKFLKEKK